MLYVIVLACSRLGCRATKVLLKLPGKEDEG